MKIKCDWCGSWINDFDQVCPNCGGVNNNYNRNANGTPQTIEELKAWAKAMNLPLQEMRTFIGEDYKGAKAFGIYKDESDGTFVVYKNKADGTRAVRYKGTDEAYAVNELYQKMKERVAEQKAHQKPQNTGNTSTPGRSTAYSGKRRKHSLLRNLLIGYFVAIALIAICNVVFAGHAFYNVWSVTDRPSTGYYTYGNQPFYYYRGDWYEWDNGAWTSAPNESWMESDYEDYYDSYSYDSDSDYEDFTDSPYYSYDDSSYDSNYDNDYDNSWNDDSWDSGWDSNDSWDSGYDDWGSDW